MKTTALLAVFAVLAVAGLYAYDRTHRSDPVGSSEPGHHATCRGASPDCLPKHVLTDIDGQTYDPAALEGKIVVVNVWATWCVPCQKEIPAIASVHEEYKNKGVVILGLLQEYGATLEHVKNFAKQYGLTYPIIFMDPEVADAFGNPSSLPSTYIYDRGGTLFRRHVGELTREGLIAEIKAASGS
jgi:thiol-disulfide isomerase/thioredoxin